jgi:hypothetical protein
MPRLAIVKDDGNNNDNNKSYNEKAIQAYELSDKGYGSVHVAIQIGPFRNASNPVLRRVLKAKVRIQVMFRLQWIKGIKGQPSPLLKLQTAKEGRSNNW